MTTSTLLVTGAGGFIGRMVVESLAGSGRCIVDGSERMVGRIFASDIAEEAVRPLCDRFDVVEPLIGDFADPDVRRRIMDAAPDVVVHLAAVVSSAAEADFDLGLNVNVRALMDLISDFQSAATPPVFLFTSSVAVYAAAGNATIDETEEPKPLSSYGTQKVMGELLIRDATRRGILRGRTIRFPTISIRPGAPNKAASSFASGILREPLNGETSVLPVPRSTRLHLASPSMAVAAVRQALALEQSRIGTETTLTLPGLSVTVDEMIAALGQVAGPEAVTRIIEKPDPGIEAIVSTWPGRIEVPRASDLGFVTNTSLDELIREHMDATKG